MVKTPSSPQTRGKHCPGVGGCLGKESGSPGQMWGAVKGPLALLALPI